MREISGFRVESTAVQTEPGRYRPGLSVQTLEGRQVSLFEVGYRDTDVLDETYAAEAAEAILQDVVRIADDGKAVFVAQGAIEVKLIHWESRQA